MSRRIERWDNDEKICMNCGHREVCKFAPYVIAICEGKCGLEEIDIDARYDVSVGIDFECKHFAKKE